MKNIIYKTILPIYSKINRMINPSSKFKYGSSNSSDPVSRKFGLDRGHPVDRYYIDKFIQDNKKLITGKCLEIGDDRYSKKYGQNISKIDILDINIKNKSANIHADLRSAPNIKNDTYDCLIITQVLGMIDNVDNFISECYRILKPNGTLLLTTSAIAPQIDHKLSYWRFTEQSIKYLLNKKFKKIEINSFGNAYIGQAIWLGMSQEDINKDLLDIKDIQFQCIVGAIATK